MQSSNADLVPFGDFETASRSALSLLHQRLGFDLWMMTRTDGNDWIVLQVEDHGYSVTEGSVFRWADSFCSQMVLGRGPRIAPCAKEIPVYANAPIGQQVAIGAYIGVPIKTPDGALFGTLCAIDPKPQDESIHGDLPWIELIARMLSTILANEMKSIQLARQLEQISQAASLDASTGFLNRQGWDQRLATEEARARRYGSPACVFRIANDPIAGETGICDIAESIRQVAKASDPVAHFGDGNFALLAVECDLAGSEALSRQLANSFAQRGIRASIGKAMRDPKKGLISAAGLAESTLRFVPS